MTIELMDGRTGEAHISSEDWAVFNAATYGVAEGVFDWGDGFKLSMSTSNKGTIGAGAGLVDGKRVWVKTPESVTIESGGQGVKRHDVVGIQYETHSTNLERAVVKVVKGTPSASPADPDLPSKFLGQGVKRHDVVGIQYETHSTNLERAVVKVVKGTPSASPADPDLPSKFLPLWRVPLDGLNVGAPVALFDKLPTAAGLRDSVSRKLDADKLTFSNSAKAFSVNSWGTGIQLDVNDDGGSYQSVVFEDSVSRKLDADKLTFSNSAKAFSVNSWGTGIQLDVNDDGGSYQSVVFDDNGIGYFFNNQRKWQIRP